MIPQCRLVAKALQRAGACYVSTVEHLNKILDDDNYHAKSKIVRPNFIQELTHSIDHQELTY